MLIKDLLYLSVTVSFDKHPEKNYTKIKGIEFHTFALKFEEVTLLFAKRDALI